MVREGRLEFVNGGWASHDEACTSYHDILTNFLIGHQFIMQEFGEYAVPRVGWHLDSFGHSATTARLLSELKMDATFFARLD